ncbi:hypothetical protein Tco_0548366 [Tanacetum coccineum]
MVTQSPKVDRKDWNGKMTQKLGLGFGFTKKACFVCECHNHLIKECDFHEKRMSKESVFEKGVSKKVNTVRVNGVNIDGQTAVSTVKGNGVTVVKALVGYVWRPKKTDLNNGSKDNSGSWISKRVRIEKTKRSKNDQKPTRNGKKTKSQEQDKEISQRSQPDQPDTVKLSQRKE